MCRLVLYICMTAKFMNMIMSRPDALWVFSQVCRLQAEGDSTMKLCCQSRSHTPHCSWGRPHLCAYDGIAPHQKVKLLFWTCCATIALLRCLSTRAPARAILGAATPDCRLEQLDFLYCANPGLTAAFLLACAKASKVHTAWPR